MIMVVSTNPAAHTLRLSTQWQREEVLPDNLNNLSPIEASWCCSPIRRILVSGHCCARVRLRTSLLCTMESFSVLRETACREGGVLTHLSPCSEAYKVTYKKTHIYGSEGHSMYHLRSGVQGLRTANTHVRIIPPRNFTPSSLPFQQKSMWGSRHSCAERRGICGLQNDVKVVGM